MASLTADLAQPCGPARHGTQHHNAIETSNTASSPATLSLLAGHALCGQHIQINSMAEPWSSHESGTEDRLTALPRDLLVKICTDLGPGEGLGAFRETCKAVRAASNGVRRLRIRPHAALELTVLARWRQTRDAAPAASPVLTALEEWTAVEGIDMQSAHPEDVRTLIFLLLHEGRRTGQLGSAERFVHVVCTTAEDCSPPWDASGDVRRRLRAAAIGQLVVLGATTADQALLRLSACSAASAADELDDVALWLACSGADMHSVQTLAQRAVRGEEAPVAATLLRLGQGDLAGAAACAHAIVAAAGGYSQYAEESLQAIYQALKQQQDPMLLQQAEELHSAMEVTREQWAATRRPRYA